MTAVVDETYILTNEACEDYFPIEVTSYVEGLKLLRQIINQSILDIDVNDLHTVRRSSTSGLRLDELEDLLYDLNTVIELNERWKQTNHTYQTLDSNYQDYTADNIRKDFTSYIEDLNLHLWSDIMKKINYLVPYELIRFKENDELIVTIKKEE